MAMSYVQLYFTHREALARLPDELVGRLIKALLDYAIDGTEPTNLNESEYVNFLFMAAQYDRDCANYGDRVAASRRNGAKGGRPRKKAEGDATPKEVESDPEEEDPERENKNLKPLGFSKPKGKEGKGKERNGKEYASSAVPSTQNHSKPKGDAAAAAQERLAVVVEAYEQNFGVIPRIVAEEIAEYLAAGDSEDLICAAIQEAASCNPKQPWRYVRSILDGCRSEGIKTREALAKRNAAYRSRKAPAKRPGAAAHPAPDDLDFIPN